MAKQLNVNLAFNADVSKAKTAIQSLQQAMDAINASIVDPTLPLTKGVQEATQAASILQSALNNLTDIKLFNGKKEIKDDELKEKIFSFYKLKKKALDSNSDYYFKNKPEKNQKVALLRRSIGEELE